MSRKYRIPEFDLRDLLQAIYGCSFNETSSGIYTQCMLGRHDTPPRHGSLRIYPPEGAGQWGAYVCHRHGRGGAWDFLEEHVGLPGWGSDDFDETILYVCEKLGVEPQLIEETEETIEDQVKELYRSLHRALEPIRLPKGTPHWEKNPHGAGHLYRGIEPMLWYSHGVGMYTAEKIEQLHRTFSSKVFETAGVTLGKLGTAWLTEGVALMRFNKWNSPVGIAVRRYETVAGRPIGEWKYLKNRDNPLMASAKYLYGLRRADRWSSPVVYLPEGEFDTLKLKLCGLENVATHGSGQPSKSQLDQLRETGKQIVIVCDSDASGTGFTHAHTIAQRDDGKDLHFLFLPNPENEKSIDPDVFVSRYGVEEFTKCETYPAFEILTFAAEIDEDGLWLNARTHLVQKYMDLVIENPSAFDERHVETIASLGGQDVDFLKSWVLGERNRRGLLTLYNSVAESGYDGELAINIK